MHMQELIKPLQHICYIQEGGIDILFDKYYDYIVPGYFSNSHIYLGYNYCFEFFRSFNIYYFTLQNVSDHI